MSRPKVGPGGRGSTIRFGAPQRFDLTVSRPSTTVYLPSSVQGLSAQAVEEILRSRLQCFPNPDQYTDNSSTSLPLGNYQVRYFPIEGESSEDITDMDVNCICNSMEHIPSFKLPIEPVDMQALPKEGSPPEPECGPEPVLAPPPDLQNPVDNEVYFQPPSAPPLPEDIVQVFDTLLEIDADGLVISKNSHEIYKRDLEVFDKDKWLDDKIINYYLELIKSRNNANAQAHATVYPFTGSFYTLLASDGGLEKVAKAADQGNIFNFDLILFPVCVSHHWILVAADNRTKTVTVYNSMNHTAVKLITNNIVRYLKDEERRQNNGNDPDPPNEWAKVTNENNNAIPQQENAHDCGVFVLQFADYLSRGQPFDFGQINMLYFRAKNLYECMTGRLIIN